MPDLRIGVFSRRMGFAYARGVARGVGLYSRQRPGWRVVPFMNLQITEQHEPAERWDGDGAIVHDAPHWVRFADETAVVRVGAARLAGPPRPAVRSDDHAIGVMAADHLLQLGFESFAFFGTVVPRREGFARRLLEAKGVVPDVAADAIIPSRADDWSEVNPDVREWIRSLPRPVAVFADTDLRARRIAWAANEVGRSLPDDLSLLGVDNDEMLCDLCNPPLSSIEQGTLQIGYRAAELIDQMLSGKHVPAEELLIPPVRLQVRQSTSRHAVLDPVVQSALAFMRRRFARELSVDDIAEEVDVSRRSLERLFRRHLGHTVLGELTRLRVEQACESLRSTDWNLERVAANAGFQSLRQFHAAFRQRLGATPAAYRRTTRTG
ncbi:MAG: substrate-binding domain-containing protein [Phycisphaerae bacterium]